MVALAQPEKRSADDRLIEMFGGMKAGMRQQIAGDMFGDELIVREVAVESPNDIIPVAPRILNRIIEFVAQGLGIADQIQPMTRPTLAEGRRSEQAIDYFFVGFVGGISKEAFYFLRRRW